MKTFPFLLAAFSATPFAQGTPPGGPSVYTVGKITIGDGVTSDGWMDGQTDAVFTSALAHVGGIVQQIEVLPGTYTFADTVDLATEGLCILAAPGAVFEAASGFDDPLFSISAPGVTLDGLLLRESRPADHGLVEVLADDAAIVGCTFDLNATAPTGADAAVTIGDGTQTIAGAVVRSSSFLFHDKSGSQGHSGLRADTCRSLRLYGNRFQAIGSATACAKMAFELVDCEWSVVADNVVDSVRVELDLPCEFPTSSDPALMSMSSEALFGVAFSGNYVENTRGSALLSLAGAGGRCAVTANGMGRSQAPLGFVHAIEAAGTVVAGNQFHNVMITTGGCAPVDPVEFLDRAILLLQASDSVVADNTFSIAHTVQLTAYDSIGVSCISNRFVTGQADNPSAAITLDGTTDHTVLCGNVSQVDFTNLWTGNTPDVGAALPPINININD